MYSVTFESAKDTFLLGYKNGIVFDIEGLSGIEVDIGTSQGASQIGESVETQAVSGKTLTVNGNIFSDIQNGKKRLSHVFSAFTSGTLYFGDYFLYVYVKEAPIFSPVKDKGDFTFQLFAPYPFFRETASTYQEIGSMEPTFTFPVTYSDLVPHMFGVKAEKKYTNCYNGGDLEVPFKVILSSDATSVNPALTNLVTLEKLLINGTINSGDYITVWRNENNVLKAEYTSGSTKSDVLSWIDETSSLWALHVGDNIIGIADDMGADHLTVHMEYNAAVGGVYET